ncbi:MAG: hypothetical protein LLF28_07400 [Nitrospiraceae bacterium]|nr:hypothetical protein [Nitrospiraceae bacterium]
MTDWRLKTPVAFIIFNRPDTTEKVFEAIRMAKPPKLLVVADGPRADKYGEAEKCKAARAIIDKVDWPCEVFANYSDLNMGCKNRVSSGLNWVFDTVEEAIILEDDCIPHPTFFRFCEELLDYYKNDTRIMSVSGDNFQFGKHTTRYSYYFSRYSHVWGWATWRRAWKHYDVKMGLWPEIKDDDWLSNILSGRRIIKYWRDNFESVYSGKIDTWDYQWTFACWLQNGMSILPAFNLISNVGFSSDATHTKRQSIFSNMAVSEMKFPIIHQPFIVRDSRADALTEKLMFRKSFLLKVASRLRYALR